MSEHQPHDPQPTPEAPVSGDVSAQTLASARRRRLIKLGAGAVPVAMTLASRPVMATDCITASAWGSVQGLLNTSQYKRAYKNKVVISGAHNVATWATTGCAGWTELTKATTKSRTACLISHVLSGSGVSSTAGLTSSLSVWTVLTGSSSTYSTYQKTMLAAWMNWKISATSKQCLASKTDGTVNRLKELGALPATGSVNLWGKQWYRADAVTYLTSNFLA